jgi:amidase
MKRREFIRYGSLAGCALPVVAVNGCHDQPGERVSTAEQPARDDFQLNELSIEALQSQMQDGKYTSRDLVQMYLERIEAIDRGGIKINSIIEINPDALSIADERDRERKNDQVRGPLHGIPFLIKDNIDTADKMMTTAGSQALSGHHASADAPLVRQLREAGAVLLGKTNLSEWANFRSSRSSSGWSSRGGQTKNPYSLERNPCGSSSGSGAAVAANFCAFAIGTETNGSISCPASINGIVGLKPTVGLVSRSGIIPISKTQDTAGPMTKFVRDAAIVLGAISAVDEKDQASANRPGNLPPDYTRLPESHGLQGKRIGVEKSFLKVHEGVDSLLEAALEQMKSRGATIVEVDYVGKLKEADDNEFKVLQYEFKDGLNRYLAAAGSEVKSLKDVIAFNTSHAEKVMPYFRQETLEASEKRGDLESDEYKAALHKVVTVSRLAIDGLLEEHKLQCICGPATGPAWCTDLVNGDSFSGYGMGSGAAMAGYPSISVPLGEVHGLPVGLLFITSAFREAELLSIAYSYEQVSKNRRSPTFRTGML